MEDMRVLIEVAGGIVAVGLIVGTMKTQIGALSVSIDQLRHTIEQIHEGLQEHRAQIAHLGERTARLEAVQHVLRPDAARAGGV